MAPRISPYLIYLFLLFNVIQGQKCRSDEGCNRDLVKCGFCVQGYCHFPFINIYTPGKFCNFNTNKCKNETCTSFIKHAPTEGYSTCVCECSAGRYGQHCEKEGYPGVTYTSGVQLFAPTVVECLEDYSVFVTVQQQGTDVKGSPRNLKVLLTTTSGVFGAITTVPTLRKVATERAVAFCKQRSWNPNICRYFTFNDANEMNLVFDIPLRMPFWYPQTWRWSNETELSMTGLTHTLLLKITSGTLELSNLQQQFVVTYSNAHKSEIPVPKIFSCGKCIESPVIYSAKQYITLNSVMLFASEDKFQVNITLEEKWNRQTIHFEWKAFRVESYSQTLQFEYYYIGEKVWRVSPFSWRIGLYIIRLETRAINLVRTDNYGQCYLKVVLQPLVAMISGGTQKVVNIEEDLVLDPSSSCDPNQPPGESRLRFTIGCNWTAEAVCQPVYKDSLFYDGGLPKPPFRYSPKLYKLEEGKVYNFTLKVELKDMDYNLEPAYAHQLVIMKHFPSKFPLESLEIECFYNCEDTNPDEIVYLKLKGSWNLLEDDEREYEWNVSNIDISQHYVGLQISHVLIVSKGLLRKDLTYQFKVVFEETFPLAIYELTTSIPPETHCSVEPREGIRFQTFFKITCNSTGFFDGYEFYDKSFTDYRDFSGRMLAFQETGEIDNVVLSFDYLEVHTFGKNGFKTITRNHLILQDEQITRETLHYWHKMNEMASASNIDILHRNSAMLEFWDRASDKSAVLRMLTWLNMVQLRSSSEAKLWTSTLHKIVCTVFKRFNDKLSISEGLQAAVTLAAIGRILIQESSRTDKGRQFTFDEYYDVFSYLLDCIYIVLESGREELHGHRNYYELKYSFQVLLHDTLHFKYKAIYRLCLGWNAKLRQWESDGSSVLTGNSEAQQKLICQWSRLSIFAGEVAAAPVTIARVQDLVLHFTPWSNRTACLECLAFFSLVFMLGFILAWWTDRHQCAKRFVVVLSDNFPREQYGYLVCVMTGARFKAGTDANVGIRIYGSDGESRAHVLRSEERGVMGWLAEDWFLLFTNHHLGTLETLHIWLDNSGKSPSWFCNSIRVFDMKMENYYIFLVNEWLTLSVTKLPEAIVKPVQVGDLTTWYRMFMDHLKSGFRQGHLWMATVFRHPRDPIKRTDRLIIIGCFILVSISTSLLLMVFSEGGLYLEHKEDLPSYSVKWIDVELSVITFTVSTSVAGLLMCMVRKSYHIWYCSKEEEQVLICKTAQYTQLKKDYLLYNPIYNLTYRSRDLLEVKTSSLNQLIALQLMEHPLTPVQLQGAKSAVAVNMSWSCRVVLLCLLIVLTSVIVCVVWSEHLGPNRVKRWLTVVAITTILHAIIYLPLKILIISFILTFAFDRIIYKDFYTFNPKNCQNVHLYGNTRHLRRIIKTRTKAKYQPIRELAHEAHRLKRQRLMKWRTIVEFLFVIMFIIVLSKFLGKDNLHKYLSNSHLRSMINASRDNNVPSYSAIYNLTQFDNILRESFSLSVFKFLWYNKKQLNEGGTKSYKSDWCYDNTHRMLGQPHFRQFRVKPGYCHVPKIMENISGVLDCAAAWGAREAEDTRVYKPYWIHPETLVDSYWSLQFNHSYWSQQFTANWSYAVNWSNTDRIDYTYYGRSGSGYPPRGYNRSLWGRVRVALSIRDEGWVDHHTRAVLTQVALGNGNTRLLTLVTLVAEQTVAGEIVTSVTVQSEDVIFEIDLWMVLLIMFTTLHCARIFAIINNLGLNGYFKKGYRIYELLLFVLLLSSIIHLVKQYFVAVYCDQIDVIGDSQHQFYKRSNHLSSARSILGVIFVLAVIYIYILNFWRFGHFVNLSYILILSFKTVIWLAVILILFLSIFCSFICYLISAFVAVVLKLNLIWKFTFVKISQKEQSLGFQIVYFMICFGSLITTTLMLNIIIYEFKKAKKHIVNERYSVDLVLFLIQEIGGFCKPKDATELRKKYEISIRKTCEISIDVFKHSIENKENPLSTSDENKQDDLEPEIPTEKQYKISSLLGF